MRLLSYRRGGTTGLGIVAGDRVVPLPGIEAIRADTGSDVIFSTVPDEGAAFDRAEAETLPVSWMPRRVLCAGLNYLGHVEETKRDLPKYPVLFAKFASSLIGPDQPIPLPPESTFVDYEGELAVVIGRGGRRIREEHALEHVLGFSVANDVTMRDFQYLTHQWIQGKAWDGATPLSAELVTPDEFDGSRGGIRTYVNDDLVQESDLSMLLFSIPRLIEVVSLFTRLEPGDIVLTGTPEGVGYRRDPQRRLLPYDVVRVEVDGVGRLESRVVPEFVAAPALVDPQR